MDENVVYCPSCDTKNELDDIQMAAGEDTGWVEDVQCIHCGKWFDVQVIMIPELIPYDRHYTQCSKCHAQVKNFKIINHDSQKLCKACFQKMIMSAVAAEKRKAAKAERNTTKRSKKSS